MTCGTSAIPLILGYNNGSPVELVEASAIGVDTVSANVFVSGGVNLLTLLPAAAAGQINTASNLSSAGAGLPNGWFKSKVGLDLPFFTFSGVNINATLKDGQTYELSSWVEADLGGGAVGGTDHGALTGLSDDDHPIYQTIARLGSTTEASGASYVGVSGLSGKYIGNTVQKVLSEISTSAINHILSGAAHGGGSLSGATDTTVAAVPGQGDSLVWVSSTEKWTNVIITPAGVIQMYAASTAPAGWLLCDGAAVSKTTYQNLFLILGTNYDHGGEGAGNFRVPDMRGCVPVGINATTYGTGLRSTNPSVSAVNLAASGGSSTTTLTEDHIPTHSHGTHTEAIADETAGANDGFTGAGVGGGGNNLTFPATASTGGGGSHENMPPFLGINFIIKT